VYVFERGASWAQQASLRASNPDLGDQFGYSVALASDGSTLAVGAPFESSAALGIDGDQRDNSARASGAAYVFARSGSTWSQQAYVKASNTDPNDQFGGRIALAADGSTLAVGASYEASSAVGVDGDQTDNSSVGSGAVYVLARAGVTWSHRSYVKASHPGGVAFGIDVALAGDGRTLLVGATGDASAATGVNGDQTDTSKYASGAAFLLERVGATWTQRAYVKASNPDQDDLFGWSVALSGDGTTMVAAAPDEASAAADINGNQSDNSMAGAGAAYLFE
jgi:hypothetical protein